MKKTIDMKVMRYLNLFEKMTRVRTQNCFFYNGSIIFAVPSVFVSRAIGESGRNVKKLSAVIGKKIKVICAPINEDETKRFVLSIISPIDVKEIEVNGTEIIISAHRQNKASLIGRNKTRLMELRQIVREQLGKEIKIV